MPLRRPALIH